MRTFLFATLIFAVTASAQRGNPRVAFEGESVDAMIAAYMQEHGVDGMSLAIVQAPYVTRATGYGIADRDTRTLVSANTMFDVADMKNAYTAVAAMQLVEAGKLDLATVQPVIRKPAEYARLETMIAAAAGMSYRDFVRKGQFERLGLKHTLFAADLGVSQRESLKPGDRHQRFLREPVLVDPTEPASGNGSSAPDAIYSSATDISIWDIGLAGEILIKDPALRKVLYEPAAANVPTSGPWFFPGHPGLMITTGSGSGFSSLLSRFTHRDELVCVTLLANREGLDLTQLARRIAGAFNPRLGPPAKAAGKRVQQSPFSVAETTARLGANASRVEVWEENGEVWLTADDAALDAVLLEAIQ